MQARSIDYRGGYRTYRYARRDSEERGVLIEGPSQSLSFLSDEIVLDLPVCVNGWEISALNYPSVSI